MAGVDEVLDAQHPAGERGPRVRHTGRRRPAAAAVSAACGCSRCSDGWLAGPGTRALSAIANPSPVGGGMRLSPGPCCRRPLASAILTGARQGLLHPPWVNSAYSAGLPRIRGKGQRIDRAVNDIRNSLESYRSFTSCSLAVHTMPRYAMRFSRPPQAHSPQGHRAYRDDHQGPEKGRRGDEEHLADGVEPDDCHREPAR